MTSLRKFALVGIAAAVLVDLWLSLRLQAGFGLGFLLLVVFSIAAVAVSFALMPRASGLLLHNADLLVPLALVTIAGRVLDWLASIPGLSSVLTPAFPLRFLTLNFTISLRFLIEIALGVTYAAWMTAVLLELVRTGNANPVQRLPDAIRRFWWMLKIQSIGWIVVTAAAGVLLLLMPLVLYFAVVPLLAFTLAWNLATAALLPVAWQFDSGLWRAFRAGVSASVSHLSKWGILLLAQILLLGVVFFSFSRSLDGSGQHTNFNWCVNAFWTGGFENECRWYAKLADVWRVPKLPIVETLLQLLFGALALAIKITIVRDLEPPTVAGPGSQSGESAGEGDARIGSAGAPPS